MTDAAAHDRDLIGLKWHGLVGFVTIFCLFGGLVYWASTVEIAGAVVAHGTVVVEGHTKKVQHRDGGIVKQVFVEDEELVAKGQLLATLDGTEISANLAIIRTLLQQNLAREARLVAEVGGKENILFPQVLVSETDNADTAALLEVEAEAFFASKLGRAGRVAQLNEQIDQITQQVTGLAQQKAALDRQLTILGSELAGLEVLYADNLVVLSRVNALAMDVAAKQGERGGVVAAIAQASAGMAEKRLQISQLTDDFRTNALAELGDVRRQILDAKQQETAALDRFARLEIRAPQAGIVHESVLHTIGGVVAPGEILMHLVPQQNQLLVNARISPIDIDKVFAGQEVVLRLSSFDQRTTPELKGTLLRAAPDRTRDAITGEEFYLVRVKISDGEFKKLADNDRLLPGMPVETFIQTGERSVLSYLIKPFVEELAITFREE